MANFAIFAQNYKIMSSIKEMPVWKWVLLFILSLFLSLLLYWIGGIASFAPSGWLQWLFNLLTAAAMLGLYAVFVHWFEGLWPKDLPLGKACPHTAAGMGIGLGYFVVVVGIMMAAGCYRAVGFGAGAREILDAFFMFLVVGVGEEMVFRGVLFRWIDEKWGFVPALVVSALVFGLVHITNDNATWWSSLAIAIEAGLLLGTAYKWSGTLWLPIGIHWSWNFSQGNVFGFEVSGNEAGPSLIHAQVEGPEWITGGAFGAEASVVAVVVGVLASAWFIWRIVRRKKANEA